MIARFTDLRAWQKAHELVLLVYKVTQKYPKEEIFGLTSQTRRAAVSVSSNIAEGFGRGTRKDKLQFYSVARTSLAEIESQLMVARDLGYMSAQTYAEVLALSEEVVGLIIGLERSAVDKHTVN